MAATKDEKKFERVPNILERITLARQYVANADLKKSGRNDYSKYDYYELGDFMPTIIDAEAEFNLYSEIHLDYDQMIAFLYVYDTLDIDVAPRVFTMRMKDAPLKGANPIQNEGSMKTYCRRYLYMDAYDIAEQDVNENASLDEAALTGGKAAEHLALLQKLTKKAGYKDSDVVAAHNSENPDSPIDVIDEMDPQWVAKYIKDMEITIEKSK